MVWAEAWALPHHGLVGYDAKKIAYLPTTEMTWGVHSDVWREEGSITVPATYARLNEIHNVDPDDHADDEGSVIKLYDEDLVGADTFPAPFFEFVVLRKSKPLTSKVNSQVQLVGRGLTGHFLEKVVLKPYDYFLYDFPSDHQSYEDDWIYGGDSVLDNGNFEASVLLNEIQSLWIAEQELTPDPTPTFDLTLNGETATIDWDEATGDFEDKLNTAFTGIDSLQVTGTGSEFDPWQIEFLVPTGATQNLMTVNLSGLNTDTGEVTRVQLGGTLAPAQWEQSVHTVTGVPYGYYEVDGIQVVDSSVTAPHSGLYSLMVDGRAEPYNTPGVQQIVRVRQGHRYEAGIWIKTEDHTTTGLFRLVIRDPNSTHGVEFLFNETFIAKVEQLITSSNTWVFFPLSFFVPIGVTEVVFRVAWVGGGSGNPARFFLDDAFLSPGAPPATWGAIWLELLADAQSDHTAQGRAILTWLEPTFTALVDSSGNAWDAPRSITFRVDSTYDQLAEMGQNLWGYVHRIRFDETDGTYKLDIFNPGGGGVNRPAVGTGGSLIVGMNVTGGEMVQNYPAATHWRVTGGDDLWDEGRDTSLEAAWGQVEAAINEPDIRYDPVDGFIDVINQQFTRTEAGMLGLEFETADNLQGQPFVDFNVLDIVRAVPGTETGIDAVDRYVTSIVGRADGTGRAINQIHVSSDVFASSGTAALTEGVRRLLRLRKRRARKVEENLPLSLRKRIEPTGVGGMPTVVVASSEATDISKGKADFVCTGTNDEQVIQEALDLAFGITGWGGEVVLTEGGYYITIPAAGGPAIFVGALQTLSGTGGGKQYGGAAIYMIWSAAQTAKGWAVETDVGATVRDLIIDTSESGGNIGGLRMDGQTTADNVVFYPAGFNADESSIDIRIGGVNIRNCVFSGTGDDGNHIQTEDTSANKFGIYILNCWFDATHTAIALDRGTGSIQRVSIIGCEVLSGAYRFVAVGHTSTTSGLIIISDNNVRNCLEEAIELIQCDYVNITSNNILGVDQDVTGRGGIVVDRNGAGQGATIIANNNLEAVHNGPGIYCIGLIDSIIADNYLEDIGEHGIHLTDCKDMTVSGNIVRGCSDTVANTFDGIHLDGDSDTNLIFGNRIRKLSGGNNIRYGINISAATCNGNVYYGNYCPTASFGTAPYNNAGTASQNAMPAAGGAQGDNFV